jgi:hypothetical protein
MPEKSHNLIPQEASHGEAFTGLVVAALLGFYLNPLLVPLWGFLLLISPIAPRWGAKQAVRAIEWVDKRSDYVKENYEYNTYGDLNSKQRIRK